MNKEQIQNAIRDGLRSKQITASEVTRVVNDFSDASGESKSVLAKVLYAVGGIIAFVGLIVFIGQIWDDIGTAGKLLITSGFTLVTLVSGIIFAKDPEQNALSQVFLTLSAITAPVAGFVIAEEAHLGAVYDPAIISMIISSVFFVIYTVTQYFTKKPILHLAIGGFFAWFYYALVAELIKGTGFGFFLIKDITAYSSMILAIGLFSYGTWISKKPENSTIVSLYMFASFALFLIAGLFLGGIWNFLYAFLLYGAVYLALKLKRTSALVVSALAIIAYLIKISSEYFANSIGWALLLILLGFIVIAVGYLTFYLNKKYIAK